MSTKIALTPRKEKFQVGVSFAKKLGARFDGDRKAWLRDENALWEFVDACRGGLTREQYLSRNGLEIASRPVPDPAQNWMGDASMDHPDSHF